MKPHAPRLYHFLGFNTQGDVGPYTLYTAKDKGLVIYQATSPKQPPSRRQQHQRNRLKLAALAWHALTQKQRDDWHDAGMKANLRISGFNLFCYAMLTRDEGPVQTIASNTRTPLALPQPLRP